MDIRKLDEEGKTICPNCQKHYSPDLERNKDCRIQDEFPNAAAEQREQLITGICSNKCWKEYTSRPCNGAVRRIWGRTTKRKMTIGTGRTGFA